jgi:hypothetical protein
MNPQNRSRRLTLLVKILVEIKKMIMVVVTELSTACLLSLFLLFLFSQFNCLLTIITCFLFCFLRNDSCEPKMRTTRTSQTN